MTRFIAPDLSKLLDLPLEEPNFETILEERLQDVEARAKAAGRNFNVSPIVADPIVINQRVGADREVEVRADHNDKVRAVLLASSWGVYLDQIAATYYGISRLVVSIDGDTGVVTYEDDDDFKQRIVLAPEAFTTAGSEGGYIFHGLELDGVKDVVDVACYGEEDGATYSNGLYADAFSTGKRNVAFEGRNDGDLVVAPEILQVVLPSIGYGPVDQSLLDRSFSAVTSKDVRPVGDNVRIEPANEAQYVVEGVLKFAQGADPSLIVETARLAVLQYVAARRRIGSIVQLYGIAAAMKVADVAEIEITSPAADIDPGSKGAATCTNISFTVEQAEASWRANP